MHRIIRLVAVAALAATTLTGCPPQGEYGALTFSQVDPVLGPGWAGMEAPFGVGLDAEVAVRSAEGGEATIIEAAIEPDHLAEVAWRGDRVQIHGLYPGAGTLTVQTADGIDRIDLRFAPAARARLRPIGVREGEQSMVLVGGVERLWVSHRDAADEALAGIAPVALDPTPAHVAQQIESPGHEYRLRYLTPGTHTVQGGESALPRVVVPQSAVVQVDVLGDERPLDVGETRLLDVQPFDAAGNLLRAVEGALEFASVDPRVCTARFDTMLGVPVLAVEAHAEGTCALSMTLGEISGDVEMPTEMPTGAGGR